MLEVYLIQTKQGKMWKYEKFWLRLRFSTSTYNSLQAYQVYDVVTYTFNTEACTIVILGIYLYLFINWFIQRHQLVTSEAPFAEHLSILGTPVG